MCTPSVVQTLDTVLWYLATKSSRASIQLCFKKTELSKQLGI